MGVRSLIKFKILSTNHIVINSFINNVEGIFIIDTGASNSCVDLLRHEKFKLNYKISNEAASSATNKIIETYYSKNNILTIGDCNKNNFEVVLFDMSFLNNSLKEKGIAVVDGIFGGDILNEFNACIDYKQEKINLEF